MEITLNITVEIRDSNGEALYQIPKGTRLTAVRWEYLPRSTRDRMTEIRKEETLISTFYIFHYRGRFLTVRKDDCHVNRYERGRYNI